MIEPALKETDVLIKFRDFEKNVKIDWKESLGNITEQILKICHLLIYETEYLEFSNQNLNCIFGTEECKFDHPLPIQYLTDGKYIITVHPRERDENGKVKSENKYLKAYNLFQQEKADMEYARSLQNDVDRYDVGNAPISFHEMLNMMTQHLPHNEADEEEEIPLNPAVQGLHQILNQYHDLIHIEAIPIPINATVPLPPNDDSEEDDEMPPLEQDEPVNPFAHLGVPMSQVHTMSFNMGNPESINNFINQFSNVIAGMIPNIAMGEDVKVTLTEDELNTQASTTYGEHIKSDEYKNSKFRNTECNICLEEYQNDDKIMIITCPERHYYHQKCIEKWLHENSNKCPICKIDVAKGRPNL